MIADFEKKYPDTEVKWIDQPAEGYADKISADAAGGTLPDVVNVSPDLALRSPRPASRSTSTRPPRSTRRSISRRLGQPPDTGDDRHVRLPLVPQHRPAVLQQDPVPGGRTRRRQPPKTYDELFADALELARKSDGKDATLANAPPSRTSAATASADEQAGHGVRLQRPKGVELLQQYKELYDARALDSQALTAQAESSGKKFLQRAVAMNPGSALDLGNFKKEAPSLYRNIGITDQINNTGKANMYVRA